MSEFVAYIGILLTNTDFFKSRYSSGAILDELRSSLATLFTYLTTIGWLCFLLESTYELSWNPNICIGGPRGKNPGLPKPGGLIIIGGPKVCAIGILA